MDLEYLNGKPFAILAMGTSATGDDDWAVFSGTARLRGSDLYLDRGSDQKQLEIRPEWIERIRPVDPAIQSTLLGAEYYLPLTVGNLSDDDSGGFLDCGLKWPK